MKGPLGVAEELLSSPPTAPRVPCRHGARISRAVRDQRCTRDPRGPRIVTTTVWQLLGTGTSREGMAKPDPDTVRQSALSTMVQPVCTDDARLGQSK